MSTKIPLKEIHLLVYPFYEKPTEQKLNKWLAFIKEIEKDKSKALIFLQTPLVLAEAKREVLVNEKKLIKSLQQSTKLSGRILIISGSQLENETKNFLSKHELDKTVRLRVYGQHADICVNRQGERLFNFLNQEFKQIKFELIMVRADSLKSLPQTMMLWAEILAKRKRITITESELLYKKLQKLKVDNLNAFEIKKAITDLLEKINKTQEKKQLNLINKRCSRKPR